MVPPPPPPGPPPPPMMAPLGPPVGSGAQPRDQLLSSIRQGTKLKKTTTIDKSGPLIAGKMTGSGGVQNSREGVKENTSSSRLNGGPQPLAGIFAGGMPKLRPTGSGHIKATQPAESRTINTINRGPPPQPPPSNQKPNNFQNPPEVITNIENGSRPAVPNKPPMGGYGKPNLAPRPPPPATPNLSALHGAVPSPDKPSPPPKKLLVNGRHVNRAQSMRAPRSPPVAPPLANGPSLVSHLSQDGLNHSRTGTLPHNFHGQKMAPSPPGYRGPRAPGIRPPPPPSRPAPPTTAPPPPPPHRTSPAPPPPRMPPAAPNSAPPAPPARNSSMRNGSTTSLMSELEAKLTFHNVQEFPDPQPFRNVVKQYNTRIAVAGKQQAPAPPPPQTGSHLQLSQKIWTGHASQC